MVIRKKLRTRGKIQLSRYFQELKEGESIAVIREKSVKASFPSRLQGRSGVVQGKQGKAIIVKIKDINKEKSYLIEPIHLKKLKQIKN